MNNRLWCGKAIHTSCGVILAMCLLTAGATAQTATATLFGSVLDESDAVVPQATVMVTSETTGASRSLVAP